VEQARFGSRLLVAVDIDSGVGDIPVPAMCIQPLVENAVKHGASMAEDRGEVRLRASLNGPALCIEVSDNGPGFPAGYAVGDEASGHGLRNIAERLRGYYGAEAELKWERAGGITRVTLTIPRRVPVAVKSVVV
jgi:LytS/YehU family sensor histidine kinase